MLSQSIINPLQASMCGLDRYGTLIYPTTFGSYDAVPLDTVIMSRRIQTQATGAIAITSGTGEYQKNEGSWVSVAGTVVPGDIIRARVTSSASYTTAVTLEITIDGVADTFSVTTLADTDIYVIDQDGSEIIDSDGSYVTDI